MNRQKLEHQILLQNTEYRCLNFGAGTDIKEGFDNLDLKDFDFNIFPYPIKDNTYNYIYCHQVLEHLREPEKVLNEFHRICRPFAEIDISVPHFNNEGSFSMLGHVSYFAEASFRCLTDLKDDWCKNNNEWKILSIHSTPSPHFGRFILSFLRRPLSLIIRGVYKDIEVKLRVIK